MSFMKKSRFMVLALAVLMCATVAAACGKDGGESGKSGEDGQAVTITFLNSKAEIQQEMNAAAAQFREANPGITVEVISTTEAQSPVERASALYAAGTPATLAMLDAGDIAKFKDKAADLSAEKWVRDLAQPNELDGRTIAFPFAVEGYGLIYNKAAVEKALGGSFDPGAVHTAGALEKLFRQLEASGTAPITIGSMDWSLGNHFLALAYAAQPDGDVEAFLDELKAGQAALADNAAFNGLLDTFDLMMKYNKGKDDPMAVTYEQSASAVAKGEAAMTFNGNWLIGELQKSNPDGEFGFLPVPVSNDAGDKANSAIAIGATKQIFIDKEKSTEEQQAAAKKFLDWLVYEEAGQDFLVNKARVVPAFQNIAMEPANSLGQAVKAYNNAGQALPFAGNFVPGDHWKVLGASMQKYLAGKADRAALAAEIEDYWKSGK
ncbi:ABC transporter substrate-binding protein [Paenibacillus dendritiformis]|nr:ABC transporter substrate-binding protein [Paenibacillus dendritiformis]